MAERVEDLRLYALSPADVTTAQDQLRRWLAEKRLEVEGEVKELEQCLHVAAEGRMQTDAWRRRLKPVRLHLDFLDKVTMALDQGYLIIPNLPLNVFAVRVSENTEPEGYQERKNWRPSAPEYGPEQLPAGRGVYVSPRPAMKRGSREEPEKTGGTTTIYTAQVIAFKPVGFPVVAVRPEILTAAQRAMALRLFDEIGLVQDGGRHDPIVVGRINDWKRPRDKAKGVTCFIGWFFDTRSL
jgi:hypothetical protein